MRFLLTPCLFFLFLLPAPAQSPSPVHFASGTVLFPSNLPSGGELLGGADDQVGGHRVGYVVFRAALSSAARNDLERAGCRLLGYVPRNCYLMALPADLSWSILLERGAVSALPVAEAWKMPPNLRPTPEDGTPTVLRVRPYAFLPAASCLREVVRFGAALRFVASDSTYLEVSLPANRITAFATQPWVQYVEPAPEPGEPEDTRNRTLHRANLLDADYSGGLHYDGTGVRVLVRDDGKVGPHADFKGRLTDLSLADIGTHGDWVSGVMAGAGNIDPTAKGMAPGTAIFVSEYESNFQDEALLGLLQSGLPITNTSYSDGCNKGYTLAALTVDLQMYTRPHLLHVFSAGNMGTTDCGYGAGANWGNITGGHKMAKNAIAVGNLLSDATLNNGSSRGPATDGRLKPDLCAHGTGVFMTQPFNTYSAATGTSFSAPSVAGALAQLSHAYQTLNGGNEPEAALLKGALLNSATDLLTAGPDFRTGYGQLNTAGAYEILASGQFLKSSLETGAAATHVIPVPAGTRRMKVMLVWSDVPAAPNAARALVNDLDMRVAGPDATLTYPWVLNPTPTSAALGAPAYPGRDSLNNIEQVTLHNPPAGDYSVEISAYDLPFGPQAYYLVWEFDTDEIQLTYPRGGEGLVAGETERIHWNAVDNDGNFDLRYTTNGGATWTPIATVPGDKRMVDWIVPSVVSGTVRLEIRRGGRSDSTRAACSIAPVPTQIRVEKVCPDSMEVAWASTVDTLAFDVFLLGKKYMERVAHADTTHATFPVPDGGMPQWISVRSAGPDGLAGRRAVAVNWPGNLKNCAQQHDAAIRTLISPAVDAIVACEPTLQPISVRIINEGLSATGKLEISYRVDNQTPVTDTLPEMLPGAELNHTFSQPLNVSNNGVFQLKIWLTNPDDTAPFNDTLEREIPVVVEAINQPVAENFDNSKILPSGWTVANPDGKVGWRLEKFSNLIGTAGESTRALRLNAYNYEEVGAEDYLYLPPLDLTSFDAALLTFDLAYAQYDADSGERLRVEVFENCHIDGPPVVVYEKGADTLASQGPVAGNYIPDQAGDWRKEVINLAAFAGQRLLVRFVGVNDFGNNLYLDNFHLINYVPVAPEAQFTASADSICRLDTMVYQAVNQDLNLTNLQWNFGTTAQPVSASGPGPHRVWYVSPGNKTVRMVATNPFGKDTLTRIMKVLPFPTANFSAQVNELTAVFNNTSNNANSYLWDFGDGTTATDKNPLHTYAAAGTYTVRLQSTNVCRTAERVTTLVTTVGANNLPAEAVVRVSPNPTTGDFEVWTSGAIFPTGQVHCRLTDASGKVVAQVAGRAEDSGIHGTFRGHKLPPGVYQLQIVGDTGTINTRVVVVK
jgi:hypothetical protein